jgi:hypothetical protein
MYEVMYEMSPSAVAAASIGCDLANSSFARFNAALDRFIAT